MMFRVFSRILIKIWLFISIFEWDVESRNVCYWTLNVFSTTYICRARPHFIVFEMDSKKLIDLRGQNGTAERSGHRKHCTDTHARAPGNIRQHSVCVCVCGDIHAVQRSNQCRVRGCRKAKRRTRTKDLLFDVLYVGVEHCQFCLHLSFMCVSDVPQIATTDASLFPYLNVCVELAKSNSADASTHTHAWTGLGSYARLMNDR